LVALIFDHITVRDRIGKGGVKPIHKSYLSCLDAVPPATFMVHHPDYVTCTKSIMERVFYVSSPNGLVPCPQPAHNQVFNQLNPFLEMVHLEMLTHSDATEIIKLTKEEVLHIVPRHKYQLYYNVHKQQGERDVSWKDSLIQAFLKIEKVNKTTKPDPIARIVFPRSVYYNLNLMQYLKHIEHDIYSAMDRVFNKGNRSGFRTLMKGMNSVQQATHIKQMWQSFKRPRAKGLDMSRFDQHISRLALMFEHRLYLMIYNYDSTLANLLRMQLTTTAYMNTVDGKALKFVKEGCRCSGDVNTALGNCVIMCALLWGLSQHTGVEFGIIDMGDDCTIIYEEDDAHKLDDKIIEDYMLQYGFEVKVEPEVRYLEQISFCQTQPVVDSTGKYVMCRDPRICLAKDSVMLNFPKTVAEYLLWRDSIAQCGLSMCSGIPIMTSFYKHLLLKKNDFNKEIKGEYHRFNDSGLYWLSRDMKFQDAVITPEARYSFWLAFGILPEEQIRLEKIYENLTLSMDTLPGPAGFVDQLSQVDLLTHQLQNETR